MRDSDIALFFAIYSVSIHFYPISSKRQHFPERVALQAVILGATGVIILTFYALRYGFNSVGSGAWFVILFNALRIGLVYIFYSEAIKRTGKPLLIACIVALEIPITMYLEYIWIGGSLNTSIIYGGLIIVVGAISILREHEYIPKSAKLQEN